MDVPLVDMNRIVCVLAPIGAAFVLASPLGWERERAERSAGLRTFPLVAMASCGYIMLTSSVLGNQRRDQQQGAAEGRGDLHRDRGPDQDGHRGVQAHRCPRAAFRSDLHAGGAEPRPLVRADGGVPQAGLTRSGTRPTRVLRPCCRLSSAAWQPEDGGPSAPVVRAGEGIDGPTGGQP